MDLETLLKKQGDAAASWGGFPRDLNVSERPWLEPGINAYGFVQRSDPTKIYLDGNLNKVEKEHTRQHEFEHTQQFSRLREDNNYFDLPRSKIESFLTESKSTIPKYLPKEMQEGNSYAKRGYPNSREALADWSAIFKNLSNEEKLKLLNEPIFKDPYLRQWLFSRMDPMHDKVMPSDYDFKDQPSSSLGRTIDYIRAKIRQATQY